MYVSTYTHTCIYIYIYINIQEWNEASNSIGVLRKELAMAHTRAAESSGCITAGALI